MRRECANAATKHVHRAPRSQDFLMGGSSSALGATLHDAYTTMWVWALTTQNKTTPDSEHEFKQLAAAQLARIQVKQVTLIKDNSHTLPRKSSVSREQQ